MHEKEGMMDADDLEQAIEDIENLADDDLRELLRLSGVTREEFCSQGPLDIPPEEHQAFLDALQGVPGIPEDIEAKLTNWGTLPSEEKAKTLSSVYDALTFVSPEICGWTHRYLASLKNMFPGGVAIASLAGNSVVCSITEPHWRNRPCRLCDSRTECELGRMIETEWTPAKSAGPVVSREGAERTPAFHLVVLPHPALDQEQTGDGNLDAAADFIQFAWQYLASSEAALGTKTAMANAAQYASKLASQRRSLAEIEEMLSEELARICSVSCWAALVLNGAFGPVLVHSGKDESSVALRELLDELATVDKLRNSDFHCVPRGHALYERIAPHLTGTVKDADLHPPGQIAILPLLPRINDGQFSSLWAMFAGFDSPETKPAPLLDRIRLFAHLALSNWTTTHRVEETEAKVAVAAAATLSMDSFDRLVGESPVMANLRLDILRAARSDRTVLLVGEPGTGKELVAQLIHLHSLRADFGHICTLVAREFQIGRRLWRSLYLSSMKLNEIAVAEYRHVPGAGGIEVSTAKADWIPSGNPALAAAIVRSEQEAGIPPQARHIYRSIMHAMYEAWRRNPLFNFLEFESATLKDNISAELFGVISERFTGVRGGPGRFQTASHAAGTLFLDNIHHLDRDVQPALLKATEIRHEDRSVCRAGSATPESVNVRILASTTKDLRELVRRGQVIEEWAGRLAAEVILIPPLRDRKEDIPLLAHHCAHLCDKEMADDAWEPLMSSDWAGVNVRGLQNVVEGAVTRTDGAIVSREAVSAAMASFLGHPATEPMNAEESMIRESLRKNRGNVSQAAKNIGWSRQKLHRLAKKYGIVAKEYREGTG